MLFAKGIFKLIPVETSRASDAIVYGCKIRVCISVWKIIRTLEYALKNFPCEQLVCESKRADVSVDLRDAFPLSSWHLFWISVVLVAQHIK